MSHNGQGYTFCIVTVADLCLYFWVFSCLVFSLFHNSHLITSSFVHVFSCVNLPAMIPLPVVVPSCFYSPDHILLPITLMLIISTCYHLPDPVLPLIFLPSSLCLCRIICLLRWLSCLPEVLYSLHLLLFIHVYSCLALIILLLRHTLLPWSCCYSLQLLHHLIPALWACLAVVTTTCCNFVTLSCSPALPCLSCSRLHPLWPQSSHLLNLPATICSMVYPSCLTPQLLFLSLSVCVNVWFIPFSAPSFVSLSALLYQSLVSVLSVGLCLGLP